VVNNGDDIQMDEITNLNPPKQKKQDQSAAGQQHSRLVSSNVRETDISPPSPEAGVKPERNGNTSNITKVAKAFEIQVSPTGKTQTSVKTLNKRKISQQKEKKATQMLAIVLGKCVMLFDVKEDILCPFLHDISLKCPQNVSVKFQLKTTLIIYYTMLSIPIYEWKQKHAAICKCK